MEGLTITKDESSSDVYLSHCKMSFVFTDDYRQTACMNVLKAVRSHYLESGLPDAREEEEEKRDVGSEKENTAPFICTDPECTRSRPGSNTGNVCIHAQEKQKLLEREKSELKDKVPNLPKGNCSCTCYNSVMKGRYIVHVGFMYKGIPIF